MGLVSRVAGTTSLAGAAVVAQTPSAGDQEVARARSLLNESRLESKAWGAFVAGHLRNPSLTDILIRELRNAAEIRDSPRESEAYAFVQSLLDALIVLNARVPADDVEPLLKSRTPECLILLARSDPDEAALLKVRELSLGAPEWLLVNNLLLRGRSGPFLAKLVQEVNPRLEFYVYDSNQGFGSSLPKDSYYGSQDSMYRFPARSPPIGIYRLLSDPGGLSVASPGTGDMLADAGLYEVFYRRILVPSGGSVQMPGGLSSFFGDRYRYLAAAAGTPLDETRSIFNASGGHALDRYRRASAPDKRDTLSPGSAHSQVHRECQGGRVQERASVSGSHQSPDCRSPLELARSPAES